MPDFIDIHAHVNFAAYDADRKAVIERALKEKVWMINVGTQKDTSLSAVALTKEFKEGVYAAVGLHPIHSDKSFHDESELGEEADGFTSRGEVFDAAEYRKMLAKPKVVAIGECGLDYFHSGPEAIKKQKEDFEMQIALAEETGKPLMMHIRDAYKDAYETLKKHPKVKAHSHFFAGNWEEAKRFLDLGITLSFTGVITFARNYDDVIRKAPLEMIMSETDCPYVTPIPYRGERNEPVFVKEVVKKIAEIRNENFEKVRMAMVENAFRVFDFK